MQITCGGQAGGVVDSDGENAVTGNGDGHDTVAVALACPCPVR